jgi:hypothetical protein
MVHLADLSPIGLHEAVSVFRCTGCKNVATVKVGAAILLSKEAAVARDMAAVS